MIKTFRLRGPPIAYKVFEELRGSTVMPRSLLPTITAKLLLYLKKPSIRTTFGPINTNYLILCNANHTKKLASKGQ